jgi:hypothetical protein
MQITAPYSTAQRVFLLVSGLTAFSFAVFCPLQFLVLWSVAVLLFIVESITSPERSTQLASFLDATVLLAATSFVLVVLVLGISPHAPFLMFAVVLGLLLAFAHWRGPM